MADMSVSDSRGEFCGLAGVGTNIDTNSMSLFPRVSCMEGSKLASSARCDAIESINAALKRRVEASTYPLLIIERAISSLSIVAP